MAQEPRRFAELWWFIGLILLALLAGCSLQPVKVTYVPVDQRQLPRQERVQLLRDHLELWRGTPYRRGGNSRRGVDCSGFVQLTFHSLFGQELPRTVDDQVRYGQKVTLSAAKPGDLVFFKTGFWGRHVGIYLEDGLFMHASQSQGVTVSSLNDEYWHDNYWQIKRMLPDGRQG